VVQRIAIDQTVRDVSPPSQTKDLYTELKKLKDLKDSGIINELEFEVQKKKLLQ
jgi:Short C-terminal domain